MVKKTTKSFNDVMPKIEFHPDLAKLELEAVIDNQYQVDDALIVRDFDSKFGKSDFALLLLTEPATGDQFTTLCGGLVVVKKIQYALDKKLLPLMATITHDKDYYDIV